MERRPSIFDSRSEQRTYRSLESTWGSDYLISDHLPVRNVLGFDQIKALDLPERDIRTRTPVASNGARVDCYRTRVQYNGSSCGLQRHAGTHGGRGGGRATAQPASAPLRHFPSIPRVGILN
jgi:hypothetical protein